MVLPDLQPAANAQSDRKERIASSKAAKRKAKRRVKRKVRRRVTRRAHIKYARLPRYSVSISSIPAGAVKIRKGQITYYHYRGIFFKPVSGKFVTVRPAKGIRVTSIPDASVRIVLSRGNYYYYHGIYYVKRDHGYEVVHAPAGALVDGLPEGYKVVEKDDMEYYEWDGHLYQEVETDKFQEGIGYEVVSVADSGGLTRG